MQPDMEPCWERPDMGEPMGMGFDAGWVVAVAAVQLVGKVRIAEADSVAPDPSQGRAVAVRT